VAYRPHTPRTFREIVLADLLRAQRLKLRIQDEIDPQFRMKWTGHENTRRTPTFIRSRIRADAGSFTIARVLLNDTCTEEWGKV
jgi:hypothetical protein